MTRKLLPPKHSAQERGFSLTEMLVVLVIIGILILLAMPKFSGLITRAKSLEAKTMLKHVFTLQQTFFYEHDYYAPGLAQIGFDHPILIGDGGDARYRIEIVAADEVSFSALATSVVDFDGDGVVNVWEVSENGTVRQLTPD